MAMQNRWSRAPQAPHPQEDRRERPSVRASPCSAAGKHIYAQVDRRRRRARPSPTPRRSPRISRARSTRTTRPKPPRRSARSIAKICLVQEDQQGRLRPQRYLYHGRVRLSPNAAREGGEFDL